MQLLHANTKKLEYVDESVEEFRVMTARLQADLRQTNAAHARDDAEAVEHDLRRARIRGPSNEFSRRRNKRESSPRG